MAPHSISLAWKIPWTEEPGRLQSMGSLRVGHDWETLLSLFTFMHWRRKWQPTPVFLPENPRDGGAWWAAVYGVTQSWTRLKWLSSSSSSSRKESAGSLLPDSETSSFTSGTVFLKQLKVCLQDNNNPSSQFYHLANLLVATIYIYLDIYIYKFHKLKISTSQKY